MSRARAALLASDPAVEEVAAAELASSAGSAVAAVVAGYFAAAGRSPGVLLAPLSLLIAGVGQSGPPAAVGNVGLGITVAHEVELHAILPLFLSEGRHESRDFLGVDPGAKRAFRTL